MPLVAKVQSARLAAFERKLCPSLAAREENRGDPQAYGNASSGYWRAWQGINAAMRRGSGNEALAAACLTAFQFSVPGRMRRGIALCERRLFHTRQRAVVVEMNAQTHFGMIRQCAVAGGGSCR